MNLQQISARIDSCHKVAADAGWWSDLQTGQPKERNVGELLCLVHSEVSESLVANFEELLDDHLPQYLGSVVETADALIRLFDMIGGLGLKDEVMASLTTDIFVADPELIWHESEKYESHCLWHFGFSFGSFYDQSEKQAFYSLIHMEISNIMEAYRKGRIPESCASIARTIAHLIMLPQVVTHSTGYGLLEVLDAKVIYNQQRADHKIENRKLADGKKF